MLNKQIQTTDKTSLNLLRFLQKLPMEEKTEVRKSCRNLSLTHIQGIYFWLSTSIYIFTSFSLYLHVLIHKYSFKFLQSLYCHTSSLTTLAGPAPRAVWQHSPLQWFSELNISLHFFFPITLSWPLTDHVGFCTTHVLHREPKYKGKAAPDQN